jgi:hypothetical protein
MMVAGILGVAATVGGWFSLLCAGFVSWGGRPIIETAPTAAHFWARHAQGQTTFAVRPGRPPPPESWRCPDTRRRCAGCATP